MRILATLPNLAFPCWILAPTLLLAACDRSHRTAENGGRETSPNASIFPAPLALTPPPLGQPAAASATASSRAMEPPDGPPPAAARTDQPFEADTLSPKDAVVGLYLSGEWRWADLPTPPRTPEVHVEGIHAAQRHTALRWHVTVTEAGRLRVVFDSRAFPLPFGSELRSRADFLGHALVFPNGAEYRVVAPGALRALFNERRLDVTPLTAVDAIAKEPGPPHFGRSVRRWEFRSRMGTLWLDTVKAAEAGNGAALFCRLLVELVAVEPAVCGRDELPVRAHYTWPSGGVLDFEAGELHGRELTPTDLLCPPATAVFAETALPAEASRNVVTKEEMAAFRLRSVDVPPAKSGGPTDGLLLRNGTDLLRYFVLDGIPVAWLLPGEERLILGPLRGHYHLQGRTFLGDAVDASRLVDVPGRVSMEGTP